jgi:diguanylate cyclase (GGDEF)-like protein/PAS domain S-box-containing protein
MVRTYVITGNPLYKHHYQEVLAIRNGEVARPLNYHSVYWDLVMDDDVRPTVSSGEKISLLDLMRKAGFTEVEFNLLALSKTNSDVLTQLEILAMRLSETRGPDAERSRRQARLMLYSSKYHEAKAAIMRPLAEFSSLLDSRTEIAVEHAVNVALAFRVMMVLIIIALMFSLWRTYQALRLTLGGSVASVKGEIDKIAKGDFSRSISRDFTKPKDNVLGWLSDMQAKLHESQIQQAELAEHLHREKEHAQVTLSCIGDAVITTDAQGSVTFLNQVAINLTTWSLADALGKPLEEIFYIVNESTRLAVSNPVNQVLKEGKSVLLANHTVLIARDGTEYNIEDSAAPIHLANGELLGCVLVFHDVTEKHRLQRDVRWQAGHDVLTDLPNRALLVDRFERAMSHTKRQQHNLAVCLLDLDKFKPVNDVYGHAVGDQLLVMTAKRLLDVLRSEDTVARLGGDEFVLLLGNLDGHKEMQLSLQRVLNAICAPYFIDGHRIDVSASVGVVLYPDDDADSDTLLRHADQAMYQAKQLGRNRYHCFDVMQDKEAQTKHQTVARIKQALLENELRVYYQPKVNMRLGTVIGMEALLRWQHPEQGIIAPGGFLPVIEQTDLIVEIGEWVLEQALRQIELWAAVGEAWPISVNIAARHFQMPDFLARLQAILARHPDIPANLLDLEILESVAQHNIDQVRGLILQCQNLGVSFSLDDFGTGYSSLSYLKQLPADTLKIDQSFIRDILDDPDDLALVKATISLANVFGLKAIAEGVETSEHGVLLMHLGCDLAQGYGIGRPMPADQVLPWSKDFVSEKHWKMWSHAPWELSDLPLMTAARDHSKWVEDVIRCIEEPDFILPLTKLSAAHQCRFGAWYNTLGQDQYGNLLAFQAIRELHEQLHETGRSILQLRDTGNLLEARENCEILLSLKTKILAQLSLLQASVGSSATTQ